jgi:hypothetical protein
MGSPIALQAEREDRLIYLAFDWNWKQALVFGTAGFWRAGSRQAGRWEKTKPHLARADVQSGYGIAARLERNSKCVSVS